MQVAESDSYINRNHVYLLQCKAYHGVDKAIPAVILRAILPGHNCCPCGPCNAGGPQTLGPSRLLKNILFTARPTQFQVFSDSALFEKFVGTDPLRQTHSARIFLADIQHFTSAAHMRLHIHLHWKRLVVMFVVNLSILPANSNLIAALTLLRTDFTVLIGLSMV